MGDAQRGVLLPHPPLNDSGDEGQRLPRLHHSFWLASGASVLEFYSINPPGKVWDHTRQSWGAAWGALPRQRQLQWSRAVSWQVQPASWS